MNALNLAYEALYLFPSNCGIDERLFVLHDSTVTTPLPGDPYTTPVSARRAPYAPESRDGSQPMAASFHSRRALIATAFATNSLLHASSPFRQTLKEARAICGLLGGADSADTAR